jgi:RNA polymerase sigma-70 factor (ECF subfamily)
MSGGDRTTALLRAARAGEPDALEQLIARLSPWLLAQARYRMRGSLATLADPEDMVQETWLVVLPRLQDLLPRAGRLTPVLVRFLATTLRRRVRTLLERALAGRVGGAPLPPDAAAFSESVDHARQAAEARERAERVDTVLQGLGERDRALLILRGLEATPFAEIAALLGIEVPAATAAYRRACARLRAALPDDLVAELFE